MACVKISVFFTVNGYASMQYKDIFRIAMHEIALASYDLMQKFPTPALLISV